MIFSRIWYIVYLKYRNIYPFVKNYIRDLIQEKEGLFKE